MDRGESRPYDPFQWTEIFGSIQTATHRLTNVQLYISWRGLACLSVLRRKILAGFLIFGSMASLTWTRPTSGGVYGISKTDDFSWILFSGDIRALRSSFTKRWGMVRRPFMRWLMGSNVFRRFSCLQTTTSFWHLILATHDLMEKAGARSGRARKSCSGIT